MQGLWSLIGKVSTTTATNFPYEIGEIIPGLEGKSVWELHRGKSKATGEEVSVFVFNLKDAKEDDVKVAKSAFRRLKTLRHPNFLRFIDGIESDTVIQVATEPVVTLQYHLDNDESAKSDLAISWGVHQVVAGLSFLINDCKLIHSNVTMASIFVDPAGEWKLGGVDYVFALEPPAEVDNTLLPRLPTLQKYDPPEGRTYSKTNRKLEKWSMDMWGLGCLIWEVFNGNLPRTSALKAVGKIPKAFVANYGELVGANPRARPNPSKFIEECRMEGRYLKNSFVDANLFLSELQIKDPKEQKSFFASLTSQLDSFPQQFCKHKILPQLLNAFDYGAAGSAVLAPLFKVGKLLEDDDYQKKIVPCVVKLFSSTDRATRIQLLQQLNNFVQHLQPATVNDQIFPHVALGFGDTVPAMREHTVKAMLLLAPKLTEKTINNQLLKFFAKLQMDEQPGIRTNTTVCLGKIAKHIGEETRQKVLISAFLRALRDPFPPARNAGIMAFCATNEFYMVKDCATRILPPLCTMTVDPDRSVRDQAFKAIKAFLGKVEKASEDPQSQLNSTGQEEQSADGTSSAASSASWAGWAVSSLTSKLYYGSSAASGNIDTAQGKPVNPDEKPKDTKEEDANAGGPPTPGEKPQKDSKDDHRDTRLADDDDLDLDEDKWEDDWGDNQEDSMMGGLRDDLLAVKQECKAAINKEGRKFGDTGDDSGSDYGDWKFDDWGAANSSSVRKPTKKQSTKLNLKQPKQVKTEEDFIEELLGGAKTDTSEIQAEAGWGEDWGFDEPSSDNVKQSSNKSAGQSASKSSKSRTSSSSKTETIDADAWNDNWGDFDSNASSANKPSKNNTRTKSQSKPTESKSNTQSDFDWGNEWTVFDTIASNTQPEKPSGDWDNDWGDFDASSDGPSASSDATSKTELAKQRREERKLKQQALKEKRAAAAAAGKGPLKLGAVKKAA